MYRIAVFFLFLAFQSNAQLLSGTAVDEGRLILANPIFIQEGTIDGWATFELAINRNGKVTSAKIVETNLKRTTAKMQIRDYLMTLKFTPGPHYPKFHHAKVKITLYKSIDD